MWKRKVSCTSWLAKSTFYEVRSEVMERNKCLKELKSFNENAVTLLDMNENTSVASLMSAHIYVWLFFLKITIAF